MAKSEALVREAFNTSKMSFPLAYKCLAISLFSRYSFTAPSLACDERDRETETDKQTSCMLREIAQESDTLIDTIRNQLSVFLKQKVFDTN